MSQDYPSAAFRHAEDARRLHTAGRHDNAFYHSGYVIECVLKVLVDEASLRPRAFQHDLAGMNLRLQRFAAEFSPAWSRHVIAWGAEIDAWKPDVRYDPTGASPARRAENALDDANAALDVLADMMLDGTLHEVTR